MNAASYIREETAAHLCDCCDESAFYYANGDHLCKEHLRLAIEDGIHSAANDVEDDDPGGYVSYDDEPAWEIPKNHDDHKWESRDERGEP